MVTFELVQEQHVDRGASHRFSVYDCGVADKESLVDELALRVRNLYVDPDELLQALEQGSTGLEDVADPEMLETLVSRVVEAVVPEPGTHPKMPAHLDMPRNEVAEVIAYEVAEQIHAAVIPATRIREKEVPGLPTRGLDLLGLIQEPELKVVISEVKASSSTASPPPVVGSGDDSLHAQTDAFVHDEDRLTRELSWSLKHCDDPSVRDAVSRAMLLQALKQLPIVAAPVLVRPSDRHGPSDFGCFLEDPDFYEPASVDFAVVRIAGSLEDLADAVYSKAREVA